MSEVNGSLETLAKNIREEFLKEIPSLDNLEKYRGNLDSLKMQNEMQMKSNEESLRKNLKELNRDEFSEEIVKYLDDTTISLEDKLKGLESMDKRLTEEYERKLGEFLKELEG